MTWTCPVCEREMPDTVRFCVHCGTKRPEMATCPACGTANPADAKFCMACATPLGAPSDADASSAYDEADPDRRESIDRMGDGADSTLEVQTEKVTSDDLGSDDGQGWTAQNLDEGGTQEGVAQTFTEEGASTSGEQADETSGWAASDVNQAPNRRTALLIGALAAIAAIAIGVAAFAILHSGGEKKPPTEPGSKVASEPEPEDGTEAKDLVSAIGSVKVGDTHDGLTHSEWGNNDGYVLKDFEVEEDRTENYDGEESRYITYAQVWENDTFRYLNKFIAIFSRTGDGWVESGGDEAGIDIEPLAGISDDYIKSNVMSLIDIVDQNGTGKDAQGESVRLKDLYKEGFGVSVTKNDTSPTGGDATVQITSKEGATTYKGEIKATFSWNEEGYWEVTSCTASEGSYKGSMDGMVGSWVSERHGEGYCYGGKDRPMSMEVKSVDMKSHVMTADISFLGHYHFKSDNPVDSDPGDKMVELKDIIIPLEDDSGSYVTAYTQKPSQGGYEYTGFDIYFTYDKDGTIQAQVVFDWGDSVYNYDIFRDYYDLKKKE